MSCPPPLSISHLFGVIRIPDCLNNVLNVWHFLKVVYIFPNVWKCSKASNSFAKPCQAFKASLRSLAAPCRMFINCLEVLQNLLKCGRTLPTVWTNTFRSLAKPCRMLKKHFHLLPNLAKCLNTSEVWTALPNVKHKLLKVWPASAHGPEPGPGHSRGWPMLRMCTFAIHI